MAESAKVRVALPRALAEYAGGANAVDVRAATLAEAIARLEARYPGLTYRLLDDQGRMRRYVLVFLNDESVSHLAPESVRLEDGDELHIVPSVAGG